jgi:hypothetical protein
LVHYYHVAPKGLPVGYIVQPGSWGGVTRHFRNSISSPSTFNDMNILAWESVLESAKGNKCSASQPPQLRLRMRNRSRRDRIPRQVQGWVFRLSGRGCRQSSGISGRLRHHIAINGRASLHRHLRERRDHLLAKRADRHGPGRVSNRGIRKDYKPGGLNQAIRRLVEVYVGALKACEDGKAEKNTTLRRL